MNDSIKLYHGDCLKVMQNIPDKNIDAIITDPPYGTTQCKWDSVIPFEPMWEQLHRIIKDSGAIVLFGSEPFSSALRMSNIKNYKYDWVWDKVAGGNPLNNKIMPMKTTEVISIFGKGKINYYPIMTEAKPENIRPDSKGEQKTDLLGNFKNGFKSKSDKTKRFPKHLIVFNSRNKECNSLNRIHPTQKPVALMEYLIKTYTLEGETILDFTMGSGTTGEACIKTNRNFIGIEDDIDIFKTAKDRISNIEKTLF